MYVVSRHHLWRATRHSALVPDSHLPVRAMSAEDSSFFNRERDRLTAEITSVCRLRNHADYTRILTECQGFEELLLSSNALNRRLEEVLGMTREYETIAALWQTFHELMRGLRDESSMEGGELVSQGLPGTGGHVLASTQ